MNRSQKPLFLPVNSKIRNGAIILILRKLKDEVVDVNGCQAFRTLSGNVLG